MPVGDSFDEFMARLRDGSNEAAVAVFYRFAQRLIALARSRLEGPVLQKEDPEDVVQSVFRSFFTRHQSGQWEFESWDSLWTLLTLMTIRKCTNRIEFFHAERRDVQREISLEPPERSRESWKVLAGDPTPSQAAVLTEMLEDLMRSLEERDREILTLQLQGYTIPEISSRVGRSERTVSRIQDRVRKRLRRLQTQ